MHKVTQQLKEIAHLVHYHHTFMLTFFVLLLVCSLVATLGNLLVIRALWKASSISATTKKLFLSLAFSDLAAGLFAQLMFAIIIAVMLRMTSNGNFNFEFLCPKIVTVCYFSGFLLPCASFLNVTAIAVYRLVTSKRVIIALACLWITSGVAASPYISFPRHSEMVTAITEFGGILATTTAYIRITRL